MNKPYVTVTSGLRGYFAVLMWWNPEGFWEPWNTSDFSSSKYEDAVQDARDWAQAEGIEYRP